MCVAQDILSDLVCRGAVWTQVVCVIMEFLNFCCDPLQCIAEGFIYLLFTCRIFQYVVFQASQLAWRMTVAQKNLLLDVNMAKSSCIRKE